MRNSNLADQPTPDKITDLVARAKALGWRGQNEIARRIGVNEGHFSRAIRGQHATRDALLERAEKVIAAAEREAQRPRSKRKAS